MELVLIDNSKVIHLTAVHRNDGQIYQPDFLQAIVTRYAFAKFPTLDELLKSEYHFAIGKFLEAQIQQFDIYGDGIIASSASDTDVLAAFVDDVLSWVRESYGIVPIVIANPERYFESSVVVRADVDLVRAIEPKGDMSSVIQRAFKQASAIEAAFQPTGFIFDTDAQTFPGRRKPLQFTIERRLGVRYSDNVFYCRAPLPTKAHLAVLEAIEAFARLEG